MGYYTNFTLETYPDRDFVDKWLETATDEDKDDWSFWCAGPSYDSMKWYDHQDEMILLSTEYPNTLFVLSGEGEEPADIWKEYYLGGRFFDAPAEMVFPDAPDWAKRILNG